LESVGGVLSGGLLVGACAVTGFGLAVPLPAGFLRECIERRFFLVMFDDRVLIVRFLACPLFLTDVRFVACAWPHVKVNNTVSVSTAISNEGITAKR
jgi:hypothetical protein